MYKLVTKSEANWNSNKSGDLNKLNTFCLFKTNDPYGFPEVKSNEFNPIDLIPYHTCKKKKIGDREKTVHFFLDDYKFEQVWVNPKKYIELFQFYNGIISPTFSIWENQPYALNVFNMYRSRWITRFYQECGVKVLIDARWADKSTYDLCFSGIQKNSPIIVNTVGTKMLDNRKLFKDGFEVMLDRIQPSKLYVYGEFMPVKFDKYFSDVIYFESFWSKQRKKINKEG